MEIRFRRTSHRLVGHDPAPSCHPVVSPTTLVLSHHTPVTVGFLPLLESVSHCFLRAHVLALLSTRTEFLVVTASLLKSLRDRRELGGAMRLRLKHGLGAEVNCVTLRPRR